MTHKRKNDIIVSRYDDTWYGRFYRRLRWDVTEEILVNASPKECLAHLQPDKNLNRYELVYLYRDAKPHYRYKVTCHTEKHPYWFIARVTTPPMGKGHDVAHVFGTIVRVGDDKHKSLITLRAYPFGFFKLVAFTIPVTIISFQWQTSICGALFFIGILFFSFMFIIFTSYHEGIDLMEDHFLSLPHLPEEATQTTYDMVSFTGKYPA